MSLGKTIKTFFENKLVGLVTQPRLMTVQLDITNACNLACTHCYHHHHSNLGAISLANWEQILESVSRFLDKYRFSPRFMLCGGEPTLSPLLRPIVSILRSKWPNSEIMVLSNGTIIKDSIIGFLNTGPLSFQVSLDGPDAERHDRVRGKGSFNKSIQGIHKLIDAGIPVSILSILSQRTSPWIGDYFSLANQLNVSAQNFTRLIAEGHGKKLVEGGDDRPLAGEALRKAFSDIVIHSALYQVSTNTDQPLYALLDERLGSSGLFAYDALIIDYKGNVKATSRSDLVLGNLLDSDLEQIYLNDPIMRKVRNGDIDACRSCTLYSRCGGDRNAAYAEFGDFTAKDPGCWKIL